MKILIADDKQESRYLLEVLLQSRGHEVTSTMNGREALDVLKDENFDLIISDILMPVMDGFEFCRSVKSLPEFRNTPFVFYTATYIEKKDEDFALGIGADLFLRKPMLPDVLLASIQELTDQITREEYQPKEPLLKSSEEVFKLYNERLVKKLEDKVTALEAEIARRELVEKDLEKARREWHDIFQAIGNPALILSNTKEVIGVNSEAMKLLGKTEAEILGRDFHDVFYEESMRPECPVDLIIQNSCSSIYTEEISKHDKIFLLSCTPVIKATGELEKVIVVATDITDIKDIEAKLQDTVHQKEILLLELYHRTRNNMQVISSLLKLYADRIETPGSKGIVRDLENKIQTMALVHQKLYESSDLSHLNLKDYLHSLIELIRSNYGRSHSGFRIEADVEDISVLIDTAIPLGLVINELIINAIKYAFPNRNNGLIHMNLSKNKAGEIILEISDNGVGVKKGFQMTDPSHLGLLIIHGLVTYQLQGTIEFSSRQGLHWRIVLSRELYDKRI